MKLTKRKPGNASDVNAVLVLILPISAYIASVLESVTEGAQGMVDHTDEATCDQNPGLCDTGMF